MSTIRFSIDASGTNNIKIMQIEFRIGLQRQDCTHEDPPNMFDILRWLYGLLISASVSVEHMMLAAPSIAGKWN